MPKVSLSELIVKAQAGYVVSFPTDTVPALAVNPEHSELIYILKKRAETKPLILMGATCEALWPYITGSQQEQAIWQSVAQQYWPGALTLVLPASEKVPLAMNKSEGTSIGVRVPACELAREILAATGPLATTSANLSGKPPCLTMRSILDTFPDVFTLDLRESEETLGNGQPSTVAKWVNNQWTILREGSVYLAK